MKKFIWLVSAVGLTATTAYAQSTATITISSASKGTRQYIAPNISSPVETQVASNAQLEAEINNLISASRSSSSRFSSVPESSELSFPELSPESGYDETAAAYRSSESVGQGSMVAALNGDFAPSVAARAATRAAHSKSIKRCALYVRKALQSAGYKFTPKESAYMYAHGTLAGAGFTKISNHDYVPQVGDVVVFNRTAKNPHGHIQIYNGNQWISDFRQNKFSPYAKHNGYTIWRDVRYDAINSVGTLALNGQ